MKYLNSIVEAIGNTPLVRLNKVAQGVKGTILVKVEYLNPGNSIKDRMALRMVEDAERDGRLKPGGTIIEGTSGNTGMGLALVAIARGYKCIFTTTDKQSQEKINVLKAVGADVVVCPTNVAPEDPRSYYSVARRLSTEIPNSFYPNQYDNMSNSAAHYDTTGPEIWNQTEGKITHFVAGVGTGGTMNGTASYLKDQKSSIKAIGIDTYGSVFKKLKETGIFDPKEIYPYLTEGIGEDILPKNVDMSVIDQFIKVTDKDAALMTRRLAKEEGLFVGWSCGSAVYGAIEYAKEHLKESDVMVIILPDHGTRYLGKVYNDVWMKNHGFLDKHDFSTARDIIARKKSGQVLGVSFDDTVREAISVLQSQGVSQLVVTKNNEIVGSVTDSMLLHKIVDDASVKDQKIGELMQPSFPFVGIDTSVDVLASTINNDTKAVLVRDESEHVYIITQADLLASLSV